MENTSSPNSMILYVRHQNFESNAGNKNHKTSTKTMGEISNLYIKQF